MFSQLIFVFNIMYPLHLTYHMFTCMNPDHYLEYGSGSTKLLNTDSILIRIGNTQFNPKRIVGYTVFVQGSEDSNSYPHH